MFSQLGKFVSAAVVVMLLLFLLLCVNIQGSTTLCACIQPIYVQFPKE